MVDITAGMVKELREMTGLGMMECKKALTETNGDMNYKNWTRMRSYLSYPDASWAGVNDGVFDLNQDFYNRSGGIFDKLPHYENLFH